MKQIGISVFAVILCLVGFRIVSPASQAAPEPIYHIAYLVARNADYEDEIFRPENLFKDSPHKVEIVYSWQELLNRSAKQPFDALVIHDAAVPMVDFEWVANAYWHGMTISTISIRPTMIAHLFDDGCLPYGYELPVPEEGPYLTIGTQLILSLHDANQVVKWFRRDWRHNCTANTPLEVTKPTQYAAHYTSGAIMDSDLYQELLTDHIRIANEIREEFFQKHKVSEDLVMRLTR